MNLSYMTIIFLKRGEFSNVIRQYIMFVNNPNEADLDLRKTGLLKSISLGFPSLL